MMLDDDLFTVFMIAEKRGVDFTDVLAMPYKHVLAWDIAYQRKQVETRNR